MAPMKRTAISMFSSLCCRAVFFDYGTGTAPPLAEFLNNSRGRLDSRNAAVNDACEYTARRTRVIERGSNCNQAGVDAGKACRKSGVLDRMGGPNTAFAAAAIPKGKHGDGLSYGPQTFPGWNKQVKYRGENRSRSQLFQNFALTAEPGRSSLRRKAS